jgi:Leucine-rich repeat (LRR) protein
VLKAWSNEIIEIQPEISLFGSIKTLDVCPCSLSLKPPNRLIFYMFKLHNNKIKSLPDTIADLTALVTLDMSHNALESLPELFFALPSLTTLNLSHNSLTSLPFSSPFSDMSTSSRSSHYGGSFFAPTITRASEPLPRLLTLDVSHNKISAEMIDNALPVSVTKLDLSSNPLSNGCRTLMQSLSRLEKLREVRLETAEIDDDAFPVDLFTSSSSSPPFPRLRLLDLGETKVTADAVKGAFVDLKRELSFDVTTEDPPEGTIRVVIGKKVIREAWELEVERRSTKLRSARSVDNFRLGSGGPSITEIGQRKPKQEPFPSIVKEDAKSAAAASASKSASTPKPQSPLKEPWEIEAEEGLLTEGGRRRARAAAAAAAAAQHKPESSTSHSPPTSFALTRYYDANTQTLTLPPSTAPPKIIGHSRAFSLATSASLSSSEKDRGKSDMTLPTHTLPLSVIIAHPFAQTLRVLVLVNRRMDRSFSLPTLSETEGGCLPHLEELNLEGCGFSDTVPVLRAVESGSKADPTQRSNEPFLPLLTQLFPALQTLDLSYNALTNAALSTETLTALILSSSTRKGLKHLHLRGNRLSELDGLQGVAELFKGNRLVPEWKLEELDLRDNEIGKLPSELGLLPLDVFLVEGNM